jgi:uncharacterized membrane protein YfcA
MLVALGLGVGIGVVMALTGAGGGILALPILTFGLGLNVIHAVPISLMAVGTAACFGALLGFRAGQLRYKAAFLMAAGGIFFSPAGMAIASVIENRWLVLFFALVMLSVAWRSFHRPPRIEKGPDADECRLLPCMINYESGRFIWNGRCVRVLALLGCAAGLLSGLLGVGGGFVIVPLMKRYTDLPVHSVVATSLGVIALVSISGVLISTFKGQVDWSIAVPFSSGGLAGMLVGRMLSFRLNGARLEKFYALLVAATAVIMIIKATL